MLGGFLRELSMSTRSWTLGTCLVLSRPEAASPWLGESRRGSGCWVEGHVAERICRDRETGRSK